uniref:B-box C-terminal domain-containing protein n=1 Tax=Podarcis muralis TaxID=64176 RepID=A0A670J5E5_PODMU
IDKQIGDALRKIITTLAVKNEEIQNFIYVLKQMLQNVEANSDRVQQDLEAEFQSLFTLLDELKDGMLMKIKQDRASRTYELQNQLAACTKALESSEELLETANQTLQGAENHDFNQVQRAARSTCLPGQWAQCPNRPALLWEFRWGVL